MFISFPHFPIKLLIILELILQEGIIYIQKLLSSSYSKAYVNIKKQTRKTNKKTYVMVCPSY